MEETRRAFSRIDTSLYSKGLERIPEPTVKRYAEKQNDVTTTQNPAFANATT